MPSSSRSTSEQVEVTAEAPQLRDGSRRCRGELTQVRRRCAYSQPEFHHASAHGARCAENRGMEPRGDGEPAGQSTDIHQGHISAVQVTNWMERTSGSNPWIIVVNPNLDAVT